MNFNVVKQGIRRQRTTITTTIKVRIRNRHTSRSSSTSTTTSASSSSSSSPSYDNNKFPLPSSNTATPYEIFHLPKTCSSAEIKSRYYDLVKIYHPDKALAVATTEDQENENGQSSSYSSLSQQQAHDNFKKVREAYTLLSNETKRRMYDHSGYGWNLMNPGVGNSTMDDFQGMAWKGGFPRNAAEWAAYDAWSASFRRRAGGSNNRSGWRGGVGHDKFGWQTYAGSTHNPAGSNWFYGYGHQHFSDGGTNQKPLYTTNARFFVSLTSLTAVLAIFQYARLHQERQMIRGGVEDKRHQTAVQSLEEARKFARSEVGRARMEEMRKRARETSPSLTEQQNDWQGMVGRGGPSGKKAYEERMKRIEDGEVI